MSHDHTFVAGEVLTATNLNDLTSGRVSSVSVTSSQGSITTITDLTSLTITFTAIASRYYEIRGMVMVQSTVAADRVEVAITDGSNTYVSAASILTSTANVDQSLNVFGLVSPGAGSVTYKLRALRVSGTGTVTMSASATRPALFLIKDIGSS